MHRNSAPLIGMATMLLSTLALAQHDGGMLRMSGSAYSPYAKIGADGKLPPVGNTVDVEAANWTNTIGASELAVVWTDPDFDAGQRAFYYVRVLEIPTPLWYVYDRVRLGAELPDGIPMSHQERAYTSPIWYTP